jgi:hypothetical protein
VLGEARTYCANASEFSEQRATNAPSNLRRNESRCFKGRNGTASVYLKPSVAC